MSKERVSTNVKSLLTQLNKGRGEAMKFKVAAKQPDEYFKWGFWSTGSRKLDDFLGGGVPKGHLSIFTGKAGAGKSTLGLLVCKDVTTNGKYALYMDAEATVKEGQHSFPAEQLGVDFNRFIHKKGRTLEYMLDEIESFSKADDVGVIVLDSVKTFNPITVEENTAEDATMALQARKYGERISVILDNCEARDITLIGINQWRIDLTVKHGDNRKLPGGGWQEYYSALTLDMTKKALIKNKDKKLIGNTIDFRAKKSKVTGKDGKEVLSCDFIYGQGFDVIGEGFFELLVGGIIENPKSGSFAFPNSKGEEVAIRGKDKVLDYLRTNPDEFTFLLTLLNT